MKQTELQLHDVKWSAALHPAKVGNRLLHRFSTLLLAQLGIEQNESAVFLTDFDERDARQMNEEEICVEGVVRLFVLCL